MSAVLVFILYHEVLRCTQTDMNGAQIDIMSYLLFNRDNQGESSAVQQFTCETSFHHHKSKSRADGSASDAVAGHW